jgi:pre-mRNA-splicing factor CDC5/CEF1
VGQTLRRLENKRKPNEEEAERKKRQRKEAGKDGANPPQQTKFIPARDAQIQKLKEAESLGRRRKLVLPPVQVGEVELEEIVKIGIAGENAKALVEGGSDASEGLLTDYEGLDSAKMARTPRTAPQRKYPVLHTFNRSTASPDDNVMTEARNLRNMTVAQTPLLGEENTPLHVGPDGGTGFEGITPRHSVPFTPNPLATPLRAGSADLSATPRGSAVAATPMRTPLRDNLSINAPDGFPSTPVSSKDLPNARGALRSSFKALPRPENNFELLVPEDEEAAEDGKGAVHMEDAAERDARLKRIQEEEERKALARRSQAIQRGLPRPANVEVEQLLEALDLAEDDNDGISKRVHRLVNTEIVHLLEHDAITYSIPGTTRPGASESTYVIPDDEDIEAARHEIHLELAASVGFPNAKPEQVREGILALAKSEDWDDSCSWAHVRRRLVFDTTTRKWVDPEQLTPEERTKGYESSLEAARASMTKTAIKAGKAEKKLGITLGGYQARSKALMKRIADTFHELQKSKIDLESFSRLQRNEAVTGPRRLATLKEEVEILERRESLLQQRYAELDGERRDAQRRIATLEEKLMLEAEVLNEAALAELDAAAA